MRTTAEQNIVLRWVSEADLPALYAALAGDRPGRRRAPAPSATSALPGHRHLQARHLVVARARRRSWASSCARRASTRTRTRKHLHIKASGCFNSCGAAPRRRPRLPGRQPQRRRPPRAALPAGGRRPVDEQRRLVRPGHRRGAVEARARVVKRITDRFANERQGDETFQDFVEPHRQEDHPRDGRGAAGPADLRAGPELLQRLGRSARVHHRRHGRGRVRGRGRAFVEFELAAAEREMFEAQVLLDERKIDGAGGRAFSAMLIAARGADARRRTSTSAPTPTRSSASSASTTTTPSCSSTRSRAASSRSTSSAPTRSSGKRPARGGAPADRGSDAVHGRRPSVLYAPRLRAAEPDGPAPRGLARPSHIARIVHGAHKLQLKIYLTPESARALDVEALIPVFHRWIKQHLLPELTIDVANYLHVPQGPGVVLIGHGSDYFLDEGEGRPGPAAQPQARRAAARRAPRRSGAAHAARGGAAGEGPGARRQAQVRDQRAAVPGQRSAGGARTATRPSRPLRAASSRRSPSSSSRGHSSWRAWAAPRSCSRSASRAADVADARHAARARGRPAGR